MTAVLISILVAAAIRSAIFAGIAGLLLMALRIRDARTKLAAWTAVLCGVLLMPLLSWWAPPITLPIRHSASNSVVTLLPPDSTTLVSRVSLPAQTVFDWRTAAVLFYLSVAILLTARFCYGLLLTRRLRRNSGRVDDPRATSFMTASAGTRTLPELAESTALSVPITVGWLRATLLLPVSWREWSDAKLAAVLAHELSHVHRGDYATLLLASLNRCLYWFSPLNWWLERHLRDLAEQASDDWALRTTGDSTGYAEVLLGFLEALQAAEGRVRWQGVSMARCGRTSRRIDRILAAHSNLAAPAKRPVLLSLAALTLPLLYLSAAVSPQEPQYDRIQRTSPNSTDGNKHSPPSNTVAPRLLAQTQRQLPPPPPPPEKRPPAPGNIDSYVIVSQQNTTMSGSDEDLRRARKFRYQVGDDYIWFRRDDKAYIIRDPATVKAAQKLFESHGDLGRMQAELGAEQARLGELQARLGDQQRGVRTTLPDLTREVERLKERMHAGSTTSEELAELQAMVSQLQARLAEQQARLGDQQARIGEEQAKLGEEQAKLGSRQAELGEEQARRSEEASERLKILLNEALKKGLAQPEPK